MKKIKLALSILEIPGNIASWIQKQKGVDIEIHDSGKDYKLTGIKSIPPEDLQHLVFLGLRSIDWDRKSLIVYLKK